ncbi:MAG: hypothetical protein ACFB2Z_03165 [Maricaulaceae bacterium]
MVRYLSAAAVAALLAFPSAADILPKYDAEHMFGQLVGEWRLEGRTLGSAGMTREVSNVVVTDAPNGLVTIDVDVLTGPTADNTYSLSVEDGFLIVNDEAGKRQQLELTRYDIMDGSWTYEAIGHDVTEDGQAYDVHIYQAFTGDTLQRRVEIRPAGSFEPYTLISDMMGYRASGEGRSTGF